MLLDTLVLVLIAFGLGLVGLTALVLVGAFLITTIAYTIWKERTIKAPSPPPARPRPMPVREPSDDDDIPEGFQGHYSYWTDPISGIKKLLPAEEVAALRAAFEEKYAQDEEQYIENWIEGRNGSESRQTVKG